MLAVLAVPVIVPSIGPTNLVAVIIPLVFILIFVVNPEAVVAVPRKVGAVTVPLKLPVPTTSRFAPGNPVPIPRYFATGLKTSKSGVADILEIVPDEFLVTKRY